jgi:hypothetical protein
MSEVSNYQQNIKDFQEFIRNACIEKVTFDEDLNPTFDKGTLPFTFKYCFSATFHTNQGNYKLHTSQTSEALDVLWAKPIETLGRITSEKYINEKIKESSCETGYDQWIYKLTIEFDNCVLLFYAAEVYDTIEGKYEIKINDEMLLVFESISEARKLDAIIDYA